MPRATVERHRSVPSLLPSRFPDDQGRPRDGQAVGDSATYFRNPVMMQILSPQILRSKPWAESTGAFGKKCVCISISSHWTGAIILPTRRMHDCGQITQNYHTFALFDSPNIGNLMTLVERITKLHQPTDFLYHPRPAHGPFGLTPRAPSSFWHLFNKFRCQKCVI